MAFRFTHLSALCFTVALLVTVGCKPQEQGGGGSSSGKTEFAFITNGPSDFWKYSEAACNVAKKEFDVKVTFLRPKTPEDQVRMLEDLVSRGIDGVAITATDHANQTEILNKVAGIAPLVTHDSDAPQSNRLVYIGMDNYEAGWKAGELVKRALPDGGTVAMFIGLIDQDNSQLRRQGCVDCILSREKDSSRRDENSAELESDDGKFKILPLLVDGYDFAKSKAQAEDTINRNPELDAMVGLWEYNPKMILQALDQAGKLGAVKVIGFDEAPETLDGIKKGTVVGTVVQNPYKYGYESIRILSALHEGDESVIPESKFIDVPARVIDSKNIEEFTAECKKLLENL